MARLDDAGVHGADCYLMQAFTLRRQKFISLGLAGGPAFAERMSDIPEPEVEPWAHVWCIDGVEPGEITDRAFEPDRRRMAPGDARVFAFLADITEHGDVAEICCHQCHVHGRRIAPQSQESAIAGHQMINCLLPAVIGDDRAQPRPVLLSHCAELYGVEQGHDPNPTAWRRSGRR